MSIDKVTNIQGKVDANLSLSLSSLPNPLDIAKSGASALTSQAQAAAQGAGSNFLSSVEAGPAAVANNLEQGAEGTASLFKTGSEKAQEFVKAGEATVVAAPGATSEKLNKYAKLCQTDGDGDYGGFCNDQLTGNAGDDQTDGTDAAFSKAGAPAGFRRATSDETLNILCYAHGDMKAGFCNSNLPIAQADDNTKAPFRRRRTAMDIIQEMIPRDDEASKRFPTSTLHLCSSSEKVEHDLIKVRGFAGLCKRLVSNNALSDNPALKGSEYGATQGFKGGIYGTEKGYEANKAQLEYSIAHPNETIAAIASAVIAGAKSSLKKRQGQGVLLLPCVKDETSNEETGFCDSLIPIAEERDVVPLIQRSILFNAHRRFARPQISQL